MATEMQIQANKINAQFSSGPKDTTETRYNAIKHGLCAKKLINQEEKDELNAIFQEFIDDLCPKNVLERSILENMALALWEQQRIRAIDASSAYNDKISAQISAIPTELLSMFPDNYSAEGRKKINELCKLQVPQPPIPQEILLRYESEADNKFYRALKAWKMIRN